MNILVHGATGRMGKIVCEMIEAADELNLCAKVAIDAPEGAEANCYTALSHYSGKADVVIDFSHHSAVFDLLDYCEKTNTPVVICTTGHTEEELARIEAACKKIAVFKSANMSIGVALLAQMGKSAAAMFPDADIEIIERHHNQKLDVPSGTALLLANRIREAKTDAKYVIGRHENGKREKREIGIHSLRLANEVGMHEIIIATGSETVTLTHKAENRRLFADGALAAARFLCCKRAGRYDMQNILSE